MRFVVAILLLVACTGGGTPPADAVASEVTPAPEALVPSITFPDGHVVRVEIAADNELRAQGLMYRDQLRPGAGMLFFFPADGEYSFWMKNTRIPLDIIWIDSDRRVVDVKFDVPPCRVDDCPSYAPEGRARYVLEVAGGEARKHGLKRGEQLRFANTDEVVAR